jgi:hypothetical protein
MRRIAVGGSLLLFMASRRHINLTPDNRVDAVRLHRSVEIENPVHGAMISDRARVHSHFLQAVREFFDTDGTVKETVFSVKM